MAGQVIVDEFLCFIQNKIDVLDEISIIQICATNFTDAEVETAKSTLYSACAHDLRNIQRKGDDKKKKCIKDVIRLLKEVDPDNVPNFVARDLSRLPPISFDYVDVTRLLKDMAIMKTELTELKTQFISEVKEIRASCQVANKNKINTPRMSVTPKRKKTQTPTKTPPLVAVPPPARTQASCVATMHTPTYRDIVFKTNRPRQAISARMSRVNSGQSGVAGNLPAHTAACDSLSFSEKIPNDNDTSFTVVVNKKRKLRNMRGTCDTACKIQVADSYCSIYVSRARKSVTVDNILEHIAEMGEECISVEQLQQKNETCFNSFKVTVCTRKLGIFLDEKFWPSGLVYRRYKERHINTATKHNK